MIDAEIQRIVDDLSGEEKVVNDRVQQLESQISELQTTVRQRSLAEIRLRELERDLLADQKLHDLVVARLGGLDPFAEVAKPSARVVSVAEVPTEPSFPAKGRILAGGIVGATVLAIILAVMLEATDSRIRSGQRIAQVVQLRNLANIPKARHALVKRPVHVLRRSDGKASLDQRRSVSVRYFLLAARSYLWTKAVILVTAPLPATGRPRSRSGLAFSAAVDGVKTLYVDLDPQSCAAPWRQGSQQAGNQLEQEFAEPAFPSTPSSMSRVLIDWTSSDPPGSSTCARRNPSGSERRATADRRNCVHSTN